MFDFIKNEHQILKLWRDRNVFEKMRDKNKDAKETYRTLDGPITANGSMCIHHCWGRTMKDAMIKYNTMRGRRTHFQNGFDAQGLWVEVEVEKALGLNGKHAIAEYGIGKFTDKCLAHVDKFAKIQTNQSIRLGQIMDWDNSYFTNSDHNIECIWNFLKVCNGRDMLRRSYKAMPWCPRCGTSLSEHEMNGQYKDVTHKAVFFKVKLEGRGFSILVWTTTPWTLSSNVAVAVNPKHTYVVVDVNGENIIVGKDAIKTVTAHTRKPAKIVKEIKGSEIVGAKYQPILPLKIQQGIQHKIIPWEDVSATEGTGAVHIAPGCGAEDFALGLKHGLKQIIPTDEAGVFTADFEWLAGLSTASCQDVVFGQLEKSGKLFYTHDYSHNYPFCWRCKTDVIFKLVEGWEIATDKIRPQLIKAANGVKWHPEFTGKMMQDWLSNMGDWNISRRRFYGLPLPIYPCDCGLVTVVGSRAELKKLSIKPEMVDKIPHLHRPYIDEVLIACPNCKKPVKRVTDVGDVWLDAGIAPFSTAAKDYMPSEVVIEMKEQVRLWFYAQLFMSVVLENRAPYENVVGYGTILNEFGKKFSKSEAKNNIDFDDAAETFGADAIRYLFSGGNPAGDVNFGRGLIDEARRKMLSLYNNYVFFKTYYDIDKPKIAGYVPKTLSPVDEWLFQMSRRYIADCEKAYDKFSPHEVVKLTENLVEELSNFYIRVNRRRFWKNSDDTDKLNAYWNLYYTLKNICIAMAPITPFLSEHIWQTIVRIVEPDEAEFVLTADFNKYRNATSKGLKTDAKIIDKVKTIQEIISLALSLRARENLKLRQPLNTLYIRTRDAAAVKAFENIIRDEVNVHNVEIVTSDEKFNTPFLTVNFQKAGAILKGAVQQLKNELALVTDVAMLKLVSAYKKGKVSIGNFKDITSDAFTIGLKSKPEYVSVTEGELTLVLDTVLTPDLVEEGILRELIRGIQVARQSANLEITRRVTLIIEVDKDTNAIVEKHKQKICDEVLATQIQCKVVKGDKVGIKFK